MFREASPNTKEAFEGVAKVIESLEDGKSSPEVDPLDVDSIVSMDYAAVPKRGGNGMPRSSSCMLNTVYSANVNAAKYHSSITSKTPPFSHIASWRGGDLEERAHLSLLDHGSNASSPSQPYSSGAGPRSFDLRPMGHSLRSPGMQRAQSMVNSNSSYGHGHGQRPHHGITPRLGLEPSISATSNQSNHSNRSHHDHHSPMLQHQPPPQHRHSQISQSPYSSNQRRYQRLRTDNEQVERRPMGNYPRSKSGYSGASFTPPIKYPDLQRGWHSPDPPLFIGREPEYRQQQHHRPPLTLDAQRQSNGYHHGQSGNGNRNINDRRHSGDGHGHSGNGDDYGTPRVPLTKSHSQPSLSEMLAMNVGPEQFEQFQALSLEQKRQSARYEPTLTDAIEEHGGFAQL